MDVSHWCRDVPDLARFVTGTPLMLGEDWYAGHGGGGRHRLRARLELDASDPLGAMKDVAASVGATVAWSDGLMRIRGPSWHGMATVRVAPELRRGHHVELIVEQPVDEARAQAGARELGRGSPALAPFVALCDENGAAFEAVVCLRFAEGRDFGFLSFGRQGLSPVLADLGPWLARGGFQRCTGDGEAEAWSREGLPRVTIARWDSSPETLRVDIEGLSAFEMEPAGLPGTAEVFRRALSLWALYKRSELEGRWKKARPEERAELGRANASILAWARREGADPSLALLQPLGSWNKPQKIWGGWRLEALGALAWALELCAELPRYGTLLSGEALRDVFGDLEATAPVRARARLRPREVLTAARGDADAWVLRAASGASRGGAGFEEASMQRSTAIERAAALRWVLEGGAWD
jgi:hypothetical protein